MKKKILAILIIILLLLTIFTGIAIGCKPKKVGKTIRGNMNMPELQLIDSNYFEKHYISVWYDGTYIYAGGRNLSVYSFDGNKLVLITSRKDTTNYGSYRGIWGDGTYIYTACESDGIFAYTFNGISLTLVATSYDGLMEGYEQIWGTTTNDYGTGWGSLTYLFVAVRLEGIFAYTFNGTSFTFRDSDASGPAGTDCFDIWGHGDNILVAGYGGGTLVYTFTAGNLVLTDAVRSDIAGIADGQSMGVWSDGTYIYVANDLVGLNVYTLSDNKLIYVYSHHQPNSGICWYRYNKVFGDGKYIYVNIENQTDNPTQPAGVIAYQFDGTKLKLIDERYDGGSRGDICCGGNYIFASYSVGTNSLTQGGLRVYYLDKLARVTFEGVFGFKFKT